LGDVERSTSTLFSEIWSGLDYSPPAQLKKRDSGGRASVTSGTKRPFLNYSPQKKPMAAVVAGKSLQNASNPHRIRSYGTTEFAAKKGSLVILSTSGEFSWNPAAFPSKICFLESKLRNPGNSAVT